MASDVDFEKYADEPSGGDVDFETYGQAAPVQPHVAGNIDVKHRPEVQNGDGSVSTVRSMGITDDDGLEVLIPTVHDDGYVMGDEEAIDQYRKTGRHLGKFKSRADSDSFAQSLHEDHAAGGNTPTKKVPFYGPTQEQNDDQGPPSDGVDPDALSPTHASFGESVLAGAQDAAPFTRQAGAGLQTLADKAMGSPRTMAETYAAYRAIQDKKRAAAMNEHPGGYMLGNLPTAVGAALGSAAALPAKGIAAAGPYATNFIANLIPTALTNTSNGTGVKGTATDMAVGAVVDAGLGAGGAMVRNGARRIIGNKLQTPQKMADAAFDFLGGTKIGKALGGGGQNSGTSASSKALRDDVKAAQSFVPKEVETTGADLSSRLARAKLAGESGVELHSNGDYGFDPGSEFGDDLTRIGHDARDAAVNKHAPEYANTDDPITAMGYDVEHLKKMEAAKPEPQVKSTAPSTEEKTGNFKVGKLDVNSEADPDDFLASWGVKRTGNTSNMEIPRPPPGRNQDFGVDPESGPLIRDRATAEESKARFGDADKPDWWDSRYKKNGSGDVQGDKLRADYYKMHSHDSSPKRMPTSDTPPAKVDALPGIEEAIQQEAVGKGGKFGRKDELWQKLKDIASVDDYDASNADAAYARWKEGNGAKPPPFEGGHFDEINRILDLKGDKRVSGGREALDLLTKGEQNWEEINTAIRALNTVPGLEKLRLPEHIQEKMLQPKKVAEKSASFSFGANRKPGEVSESVATEAGPPPKKYTADELSAKAKAANAEALASERTTWRDAVIKAKDTVETTQDNIANKWALDKRAGDASKALTQRAEGRKAAEKIATGAGTASGAVHGGIVGAVAGNLAARKSFQKVMKGVDVAGEYGQKMAAKVSALEKMAQRDDKVGRAARYAMQAKDSKGVIARIAAIADWPDDEHDKLRQRAPAPPSR